jgi:peroxiredoxin (alkyl hydroperoxide reductase subunit C)
MCLVTKQAPDFEAEAVMPDNSFETVSLAAFRGRHVLVFFYPLDFTFVCPSEILAFNRQVNDFRAKNCELLGISVDSIYTHLAWKNTPIKQGGIGPVQFPLISDISKSISTDYGVLLDEGVSLRGLFLIDREGVVRHQLINDLPLGRNWRPGDDAMKPTPEGVADYLSKHGS